MTKDVVQILSALANCEYCTYYDECTLGYGHNCELCTSEWFKNKTTQEYIKEIDFNGFNVFKNITRTKTG